MEGGHDAGVRQDTRGLLSRRAFRHGQSEGTLLVEAERIHAINDDLACECTTEALQERTVAVPGHRHDDDVARSSAVLIGHAAHRTRECRSRLGRTPGVTRTQDNLAAGHGESASKASTLLARATEHCANILS